MTDRYGVRRAGKPFGKVVFHAADGDDVVKGDGGGRQRGKNGDDCEGRRKASRAGNFGRNGRGQGCGAKRRGDFNFPMVGLLDGVEGESAVLGVFGKRQSVVLTDRYGVRRAGKSFGEVVFHAADGDDVVKGDDSFAGGSPRFLRVARGAAEKRIEGGSVVLGVAPDDMLVKSAAGKGVRRVHNAEGVVGVHAGADLPVIGVLQFAAQIQAEFGRFEAGVFRRLQQVGGGLRGGESSGGKNPGVSLGKEQGRAHCAKKHQRGGGAQAAGASRQAVWRGGFCCGGKHGRRQALLGGRYGNYSVFK